MFQIEPGPPNIRYTRWHLKYFPIQDVKNGTACQMQGRKHKLVKQTNPGHCSVIASVLPRLITLCLLTARAASASRCDGVVQVRPIVF